MGMACLAAGVWGGLVRLPLNLPLPGGNANWITFHGPLMVCGFLGTLIGLERAVGLRGYWPYLAPLFTGLGAILVAAGRMDGLPVLLITLGSLWFWGVLAPAFRKTFYSHVALLNLALWLRIGSDVAQWGPGRQWGGILSAAAVGLFLINTVTSFIWPPKPAAPPTARRG